MNSRNELSYGKDRLLIKSAQASNLDRRQAMLNFHREQVP
jgi:hypothetical protein